MTVIIAGILVCGLAITYPILPRLCLKFVLCYLLTGAQRLRATFDEMSDPKLLDEAYPSLDEPLEASMQRYLGARALGGDFGAQG